MIGPNNLGSHNSGTPADLAAAKAIHDEVSDEDIKRKKENLPKKEDELKKSTTEKEAETLSEDFEKFDGEKVDELQREKNPDNKKN